MLSALPPWLKGSVALFLLCANTAILAPFLLAVSLSRFVLPLPGWQNFCTRVAIRIAEAWMSFNSCWMRLTQRMHWEVSGLEKLQRRQWYLVIANHQSWADILILQHLLNRRIPMMKFFLKQELIWVPLIGICWWALDFPFMKRYTKEYLARHPEKRGQDLASTRRACEKFKLAPTTVFNFLEGTRFTAAKQRQQNSPYRHLLKPKSGGLAFVLGAMGDYIHQLVDITIAYPDQAPPSFWHFLSGRVSRVQVAIELREIPQTIAGGDYSDDPETRSDVNQWVNDLWTEKDLLLSRLHGHSGVAASVSTENQPWNPT